MILTDAQERLRAEAATVADTVVRPVADQVDRHGGDVPQEVLDAIAERGWFGLTVPAEYGGLGLGMVEYCLVVAELARAWLSVASIVGRANAILDDVLDREEDRRRYLPEIAAGRAIGAFALSEEDAGSDVANVACAAEQAEDGAWIISGEKKWCGLAERADFILLYARTDAPDPERPHVGISAFVVDKSRGELPPDTTGEPIDKIGYHGLTTWRLRFDGLRLPSDALKGARGQAFYGVMAGLDRKRIYTAARAVGVAQGALHDAIAYTTQRTQFGQEIAEFQSVRFRLADIATEIAAARALTFDAATTLDAGRPVTRAAAQAKLFATEVAARVTGDALHLHGGNGYTFDHAVQRHWRDARLMTIFEGTSEIQRRIIADHLLDDAG